MTNSTSLFPGETLDLESLDFSQAKAKVKNIYLAIRSEKGRAVFSSLLKPFFQSKHMGRVHHDFCIGLILYDKGSLEFARMVGDRYEMKGAGALVIGSDVTPELVLDTIQSISVTGLIFAPEAVWKALQGRVHSGVRLS